MAGNQSSRRTFIAGLGAAAGATALGAAGCGSSTKNAVGASAPHPSTPDAALAALKEGNDRYRRGHLQLRDFSPLGKAGAASAQKPFAAIITCADSRLSTALIFDV